jgi:hypothetical protein
VDHDRRLPQGEADTMAIESDERIAEPLSLGCPVRQCAYGGVASGEQTLKSSERFMGNGDVIAAEKL